MYDKFISGLSILSLVQVQCCFNYCSFVVSFQIGVCESSNFVLFQRCFGCLGFFGMPYGFQDQLFLFCQKSHCNFDKDCIVSLECFEVCLHSYRTKHFVAKTQDVFHLFRYFKLSFNNVLGFSEYKYYISFVKFILKYFVHFYTVVSGIVFLISFLYCSLLAYKNTVDFLY